MAEDEDDYIKSLREKYPFQEQAKQFYEMVLLKKVDIKELRKEMESVKIKAFEY